MLLKLLIGIFCRKNNFTSAKEELETKTKSETKKPLSVDFAHLNINSVRNKFSLLSDIIKSNIDILMISETKFDSSFPNGQFQIHGYSEPYRFDRNVNGGGMLVFIQEDIPIKLIDSQMKVKWFFIEVNLRPKKWLFFCSYNPKYSQISHHLKEISKNLDVLTSKYDNIILMADFDAEPADTVVSDFCEIYNLKNIIRAKTFGF